MEETQSNLVYESGAGGGTSERRGCDRWVNWGEEVSAGVEFTDGGSDAGDGATRLGSSEPLFHLLLPG